MANAPVFPGVVKTAAADIDSTDSTTAVTLISAGSSGAKVESISATSTDTVSITVQIVASVASVDYTLGEVAIPAGAGTNGSTKAVDVLNVTDLPWLRSDGVNRYILLGSGVSLKIKPKTAVTAGKVMHVFAQAGDF